MDTIPLPHPDRSLLIEPLDHPNPYDFRRAHRHDYFEVILVESGEGYQFIDDDRLAMHPGDVFVVYPGQVHLMHRGTAMGRVVQFRKDIFEHLHPLKHHQLYLQRPHITVASNDFHHLADLVGHMQRAFDSKGLSPLAIHRAYNYLSILLITLIERTETLHPSDSTGFTGRFLSLLGQHIRDKRKVAHFAEMMACSTDTLTALCKAGFGKTPLKLIHEELLLEIRRLMLLDELSLKEIAHTLNFDSTSNFSTFVKEHTGSTPTELKAAMLAKRSGAEK